MVFDIVELGRNVAWQGKRLNRPNIKKTEYWRSIHTFSKKRKAGIKNEMAFALIEMGRYTRASLER